MSKASEAASILGKKGGKARAEKLSKKRRIEIASQGGKARAASITKEERTEIANKAWTTKRSRAK